MVSCGVLIAILGVVMPWSGRTFSEKHNKKLRGEAAEKAAKQATAMVKEGVPEGVAIATANKTGNKFQRRKERFYKK